MEDQRDEKTPILFFLSPLNEVSEHSAPDSVVATEQLTRGRQRGQRHLRSGAGRVFLVRERNFCGVSMLVFLLQGGKPMTCSQEESISGSNDLCLGTKLALTR